MPIDLSKLENVRERGGKVIARCPACAELGEDRKADNLAIFNGGAYRCIKDDNEQHSRRIYQIAGAEKSASLQWTPPPPRPHPSCQKPAKPLPTLSITTPERLRQIAISRGHAPDGMEVLVERGLLFTAEVYDDGKTWLAWIVTDPILCANIRRLRLAHGLSQEAAAEKAGLGPRHFQDIEAGRREGIRLATVEKIAAVLEVEVWQLFKPDGFPEPTRQRGKTGPRIAR